MFAALSRSIVCASFLLVAGCGGGSLTNESDIANRADAIADAANATVDEQIREIEQEALEAAPPLNTADTDDAPAR